MENKMYIVYITEGEYSYYSVKQVYVGKNDPTPILDTFINEKSQGKWKTCEEFYKDHCLYYVDGKLNIELCRAGQKLKDEIQKQFIKVLEENGFEKSEATEVWLGCN
jgi:hypothetical protein